MNDDQQRLHAIQFGAAPGPRQTRDFAAEGAWAAVEAELRRAECDVFHPHAGTWDHAAPESLLSWLRSASAYVPTETNEDDLASEP